MVSHSASFYNLYSNNQTPRKPRVQSMDASFSLPESRGSERKRRRHGERSDGRSLPPHLPKNSINPFSRSPSERRQASLAGLKDTDEDPTRAIKHFPHAGFKHEILEKTPSTNVKGSRRAHRQAGKIDNSGRELQKHITRKRRRSTYAESRLDVLLRSIHQLLDLGEIKKSARLFSVLLQLRLDSKPVDIRQHNIWALGAEIIMREGEEDTLMHHGRQETCGAIDSGVSSSPDFTHIGIPRRWGSAANINKVKAYFEELIRQHPYDPKYPENTSALDFQLTMLSCEIYSCYEVYVTSINTLTDNEEINWEETRSQLSDQYFENEQGDSRSGLAIELEQTGPQPRLQLQKERNSKAAHATMEEIAKRLESLTKDLPYSRSQRMLQLQETVSRLSADFLNAESRR